MMFEVLLQLRREVGKGTYLHLLTITAVETLAIHYIPKVKFFQY